MKIRHILLPLLPALALADNATTVPDDEPWHPPLPEELLSPQKGNAALPSTAQPLVAYRAPRDEDQAWLKLLPVKPTESWADVFQRLADSSHARDMGMCHGYALWLKGQEIVYLRYDDDLSHSGIHADGHAYGVLYVEFSPYGVRVCPMEGYDLSGKNGGVCWQTAATRLWSWAEAESFWAELPKLLRADAKRGVTSAQDSAVKREVATKGQRMVVFWAQPHSYQARQWWPHLLRLHAVVGPQRFSLIAPKGLNLWNDLLAPEVKPARAAASGAAEAAPAATAAAAAPAQPIVISKPTPATATPAAIVPVETPEPGADRATAAADRAAAAATQAVPDEVPQVAPQPRAVASASARRAANTAAAAPQPATPPAAAPQTPSAAATTRQAATAAAATPQPAAPVAAAAAPAAETPEPPAAAPTPGRTLSDVVVPHL